MKILRILTATSAIALLSWSGAALAQQKSADCDQPSASVGTQSRPSGPAMVSGTVTKVDPARGTVTVQGADGTAHEFQTNQETLKDIKPGDRLEAKLRAQNC